jgi:molecular chaperone DnaK (HSP70)
MVAASPPAASGRQIGTLAIDLGSTTTVVAFQAETPGARPELLALPPFSCDTPVVVPSLIWLSDSGSLRPLIGRQVLDAGLADAPGPALLQDFKRWIGGPAQAGRDEGLISAEAAGTLLLKSLLKAIPSELEIRRLVCSAPIEALAGYRRWLQVLGQELNVQELALVDEPTAAALGCQLPPGSRVLVVDVGGGTIDLSLVELPGGEGRAAPIAQLLRFAGRDLGASGQKQRCARVLGKAGVRLGGRDLDRWLAAEVVPECPPNPGLLAACERLKCALSDQDKALATWSDGQQVRSLQLSRTRWDEILRRRGLTDELDRLLETVLAAGRAGGVSLADITAVLPVGGGSRLPIIRSWLKDRCPGLTIRTERPIEAVALGALALTPGVAIKDVLSRGVSLRCWDQRLGGYHWHPLFLPGQSWPTEHPLELVLACSETGQTVIELVLGEPEADQRHEVIYRDGIPMLRPRPAGESAVTPWPDQALTLPLHPPGEPGQDRLSLQFSINDDAELTVEWRDLGVADRTQQEATGKQVLALGMVR